MMSVWGIGFFFLACFIDAITICITGINAIGVFVNLCKKKVISPTTAVALSILSFVYVVDVVISIVMFIKIKRKIKNQLIME